MKRLLVATAVLCAGFAGSASALTLWQGNMMITAVNSTCVANNWNVGNFFTVAFRPANIGPDNGSITRLSLIGSRNAQTYGLTNDFVNGTYSGNGIGSTAFPSSWTSAFTKVSVKPAPDTTVKSVTLKATIANFFNTAGCTLTIEGAAYLRPDSPP
jgi:hypothetical protein